MWVVALSVSVGTGVGTTMWTNWQNERRHREMLAAAAARNTSTAIATPAKLGDSVVVSESVAVAMGISSAEAFGIPSLHASAMAQPSHHATSL